MPQPLPILLIGPMCAGKSTIAALLADRLNLPRFEIDEHRWDYYREIGYDSALADRLAKSEGMPALLNYWKPFEVHAVERAIADHPRAIIDLGAGHTVHDDPHLMARIRRALAPLQHIILLLPCEDETRSTKVLNTRMADLLQREVGHIDPAVLAANEAFVRHKANREITTLVVYTEGRTPDETCEEIIEAWGGELNPHA